MTGLLVRRTVPAMGAAGLATGSALLAFGQLRQHLWPAMTRTGADLSGSATDWPVESGYHPASHFWPIQFVETGVVLALTALLTVAAFRLLRRHHA
ncbi:hypothetical protein [Streptomyces formicae]|uniref:Transmembrane protein n=1 Tax=Streptomyces formicae TaxID=1616117 RepID=A0ABY3X1U3_9ACTN|nr:hypothetical protein [Streptomyces formicae]UNM15983.1 hypothetical protein J4032_34945 [Streptomyces formicae]